jgi:DNA-binding NtrC family response regulator
MSRNKILVVDDEPGIRFGIRKFLNSKGYNVSEAFNCEKAKEMFRNSPPDAAVLDYSLPDGTALDLLPYFKEIAPSVPLLILTAHGSIDLAVQAIKLGAEQFLTKPIELPALLVILERLLDNERNRQKILANKTQQASKTLNPFIGSSKLILELKERVKRVINVDSPILILGETGTGKGVLSKWLHENSNRSDEPFVDLNCAGLSKEFLETELFGHEKGAFTSAIASKAGLFEIAHQGTVFLDEIGDVDTQIQPKLLKVLEEKRFRRLGSTADRQVDIRLIAATHQNLPQLVEEKQFRSDLYFRINTIPLRTPSLRERPEDIPLLANQILKELAYLRHKEVKLSVEAEKTLQSYFWPGNIRQLRNVLEQALLFSDGNTLFSKDLYLDFSLGKKNSVDEDKSTNIEKINSKKQNDLVEKEDTQENFVHMTLDENEKYHIERVLKYTRGRVEPAAKKLGISRNSLYIKIKKYNIANPKES